MNKYGLGICFIFAFLLSKLQQYLFGAESGFDAAYHAGYIGLGFCVVVFVMVKIWKIIFMSRYRAKHEKQARKAMSDHVVDH